MNNSKENGNRLRTYLLVAVVTFLAAVVIVPWIAITVGGMPSAGPDNVTSEHAAEIYANVAEISPQLGPESIRVIEISMTDNLTSSLPFSQIHSDFTTRAIQVLLGVSAITVLLTSLMWFAMPSFRAKTWGFLLSVISWTLLAASIVVWVVSRILGITWDEAFVFASAAKNFSETGVPGVPVTGPNGVAESSVDLLVIIGTGAIKVVSRAFQTEVALIFASILLSAIFAFCVAFVAHRKYQVSRLVSVGISVGLLLIPATMSTLAGGMPTVVGTIAWPLFGLVFFVAVASGSRQPLVWTAVAMLFVRWDLGAIAAATSFGLWIYEVIVEKKSNPKLNPRVKNRNWMLLIPIVGLLGLTGYRLFVFGSPAPSGLLGKNVGIDGAYLQTGVAYFRETLLDSLWLLVIAVFIAMAILFVSRETTRRYFITLFVISLPAITYLPGGRDWFPTAWTRYTLPSAAAIVVLSLVLIASARWSSRPSRKILGILISILLIIQVPGYLGVYQGIVSEATVAPRANCLALAGKSLKVAFPTVQSVASPEVNTVAYFAGAKLTDLIGIVDPRTAGAPKSPLIPGDLIHRRANPNLISTDAPDAIYLYEGADCSLEGLNPETEAVKWSEFLAQDVSKFRAGSMSKLLESYSPVTIHSLDNGAFRFLVRTDKANK